MKDLIINCDCIGGINCGRLRVHKWVGEDGDFDLDLEVKKKGKWINLGGINLQKENVKKLIKFLQSL